MTLTDQQAEYILDALRDRRVTAFDPLDDGTFRVIWNSSGPGSPQSGIAGVRIEDLLGALLRRIEKGPRARSSSSG